MGTYTVNINERTNAGKALIGYLLSLGVIYKKPEKELSGYDATLQAVNEVKAGKVNKYTDFDEFKKKMYEL